ncbi:ABC transporter permease [Flavimaricola marinus]|uniref:Putative D,D-dipeptide transport system permease protein DdpC n=1 Tax=Flavimaricola marinus TaxID=1819565 RepID=A0A238LF14_9RHOB|nr:ABC transporter permease [Flavimaricola marinus]SMY08004.1 putative D,D-dipeptide transport system permease protein DdpC [Flavimaricola marinus]
MTDASSPLRRPSLPRETALRVRMRRSGELAVKILSNPTTIFGFVIILLMLSMALFAPWLTTPNAPDPYQMPRDWGALRMPPGTPNHPLGTTNTGGDVLYGIIWGSRTSLQLSIIVVSVTVVIGTAIGSIAGMVGGKIDEILMRIVDVFLSIPELIFALAIAAILGPSFTNIILSLCLVFWVKYARIMRAQIILVKQNDYVDAARIMGDSRLNIYFRDILPNAATPVIVQATLDMGAIVLIGATLSFIGLAESGIAEWGVLVSEGQAGIASGRWWASTFPGLMIFLWALAFNLVGDGLRDALDPRTEGR